MWYLKLAEYLEKRGKKRIIYDHSDSTKEYLHRHYITGKPDVEHKYIAPYLHHILMSDDDTFHSHPNPYIAIILDGIYDEHTPNGIFRRRPGSIRLRGATSWHRLEAKTKSIWTIFIALPRLHKWFFKVDQIPVYWKIHLAKEPFNQNPQYWLKRWKELYAARSRKRIPNAK